jgi:four helix bundle protein
MQAVQSHKDLIVWQKAMDMVVNTYGHAQNLPKNEIYGLTSQLTRAAVSVPANIAEGNARGTTKDYSHFLSVAKGSLVETETLLLLSVRLSFLCEEEVRPTLNPITEIGKMLTAIRAKLSG